MLKEIFSAIKITKMCVIKLSALESVSTFKVHSKIDKENDIDSARYGRNDGQKT